METCFLGLRLPNPPAPRPRPSPPPSALSDLGDPGFPEVDEIKYAEVIHKKQSKTKLWLCTLRRTQATAPGHLGPRDTGLSRARQKDTSVTGSPSYLRPGAGAEEAPHAGIRHFCQLKPGQSLEKSQLKDDQTGGLETQVPGRRGWLAPGAGQSLDVSGALGTRVCRDSGRLSTSPWAQESGRGKGASREQEVPAETSGAVRAQGVASATARAQREAPDERCSGEPETTPD